MKNEAKRERTVAINKEQLFGLAINREGGEICSARKLAKAAGINKDTAAAAFRGENVEPETASKIAAALGVKSDAIIDRERQFADDRQQVVNDAQHKHEPETQIDARDIKIADLLRTATCFVEEHFDSLHESTRIRSLPELDIGSLFAGLPHEFVPLRDFFHRRSFEDIPALLQRNLSDFLKRLFFLGFSYEQITRPDAKLRCVNIHNLTYGVAPDIWEEDLDWNWLGHHYDKIIPASSKNGFPFSRIIVVDSDWLGTLEQYQQWHFHRYVKRESRNGSHTHVANIDRVPRGRREGILGRDLAVIEDVVSHELSSADFPENIATPVTSRPVVSDLISEADELVEARVLQSIPPFSDCDHVDGVVSELIADAQADVKSRTKSRPVKKPR